MKNLFLIGGTMGIGKTAVCQQLKKELPNSVFLDGDWCWDASPFQVTSETKAMVLDNITYMLNNFICCPAYDNIIFCWVMHEQSIIDSICERLKTDGCHIRSVSLIASETAVRERLARDISTGIRAPEIMENSIARLPMYQKLNTIKINTTGKSIPEISCEIQALQ